MKRFRCLFPLLLLATSCGTTSKSVAFQCDRQDIQLYVNDQLIGSGQGIYTTEPGEERVHLSCRENGIEVYSKDYQLGKYSSVYYEVTIPKNLQYNTSRSIKPKSK